MRIAPFFILACGAFFLVPAPLAAVTLGCPEYKTAQIDVHPQFDDVTYDFREPMFKIRELAEKGKSGTQSESWPVGLSVGQMFMRITSDVYKSRTAYDPNTCGQLKAIHVELGFIDNTIYIAREFPKRSCPYKVVLEHEEKHKAVDRALLEEYIDKAHDFFADTAEKIGVLRDPSGSAIEGLIDDSLNKALDHFSAQMESERKKRQKEVDSAEEYARVSAACDGNIMQIVHDRLELLEQTYPGITKSMETPPPGASPPPAAAEPEQEQQQP